MKKSQQNTSVSQTSMALLSEGKSTRLQQMRRKAFGVAESQKTQPDGQALGNASPDSDIEAELLQLRQMIDQRLQEILSGFPPNRQQRFFKIRYGVTPEQLKALPIGKILHVLKLKQNQSAGMKRIADLDYNGRLTINPAD